MQRVARAATERIRLDFYEKLEELFALVAVSMAVEPEKFPAWSDGFTLHMAELNALWFELRPQLNIAEEETLLDRKLEEMYAAFKDGRTARGMRAARSLYADLNQFGKDESAGQALGGKCVPCASGAPRTWW